MAAQPVETGSCFCGEITAELRGAPFWICYDHDDDCRRAVGSPLTIWVGVRPHEFRVTRGVPKSFSKTKGVVRTFCPTCGTSITYSDSALQDELYVTIGFLDHPERFRPEAHAYWGLRLPWLEISDWLPRIEEYSRRREASSGTPRDRKKITKP
ncbi:MAG TPA: GFA family protein [Bradyrhizobium sp.]|nr:GFA family protein [Bradyrhizobium sp.]